MINIMPDEAKKQLKAARTNLILLRYTGVIVAAFGFIVLVFAGSYVLLTQTKTSAEALIAANTTQADVFSETQMEIDALSSNLSGARTILDQQILYSAVLKTIGQTMPAGTVIDEITLNPESFGATPVSITVYATSTEATVTLRESFQNSPTFSGVNLESVSESNGIEGYPVSATMQFTINRTTPQ